MQDLIWMKKRKANEVVKDAKRTVYPGEMVTEKFSSNSRDNKEDCVLLLPT
jgi:hypothetical protein